MFYNCFVHSHLLECCVNSNVLCYFRVAEILYVWFYAHLDVDRHPVNCTAGMIWHDMPHFAFADFHLNTVG